MITLTNINKGIIQLFNKMYYFFLKKLTCLYLPIYELIISNWSKQGTIFQYYDFSLHY